MRRRRQAPTGRRANPTLAGGSDDEAACAGPAWAGAPPTAEARTNGATVQYNEIPPVDRSCGSYQPGHRVHWIQAKKSMEPQLKTDVTLTIRGDGVVDITSAEETIVRWNHDPHRLRMAWNQRRRAVWQPRFHVILIPGPSGLVFNMGTPDQRTPCLPGPRDQAPTAGEEPVLGAALMDRVEKYGGFSVRLGPPKRP